MEKNLDYLKQILEGLRSVTKPVVEGETTIDATWDEVYDTIAELQKERTEVGENPIVARFKKILVRDYPHGVMLADQLYKDGIVFEVPGKKDMFYVKIY